MRAFLDVLVKKKFAREKLLSFAEAIEEKDIFKSMIVAPEGYVFSYVKNLICYFLIYNIFQNVAIKNAFADM